MISRCLVLTGFTLAAASFAFGTTYYVDSNAGNDSNNGTSQSTPWQSVTKVNSVTFQPGDQILFLSGDVWTGALSPKGSGSAGNPITIGNYGSGALPLIQGNGVSATVSISGQQYWDVTNLEITNQAATAGNYLAADSRRTQTAAVSRRIRVFRTRSNQQLVGGTEGIGRDRVSRER